MRGDEDWVAHTELQACAPGGARHRMFLAVSRPNPQADGGWEVSLRISPLLDPPIRLIGEDGWQAINIALTFAEHQLRDLIAKGWIFHLQDDPIDELPLSPADLAALWGRTAG
ncbi:hypothetical protein IP84_04480 [beta proteobacterium AAP99]|nr:hypothetical protein IP84_04480 [beta proteobacterium AAP99]